jgi:hypothetical protein
MIRGGRPTIAVPDLDRSVRCARVLGLSRSVRAGDRRASIDADDGRPLERRPGGSGRPQSGRSVGCAVTEPIDVATLRARGAAIGGREPGGGQAIASFAGPDGHRGYGYERGR